MESSKCLSYIDDTNNVGASTLESTLKTAMEATGKVTVTSVANNSVSGSTATADVTMTVGGQPQTAVCCLVRKDGSWEISSQ